VIRFSERGTSTPEPREDQLDGPGDPVEHASPGLKSIVDRLDPESKIRVLDLGPAVSANISFFSQYSSHIRIADAVDDLRAIIPDEDDPGEVHTLVADILPMESSEFDLVMIWDLLSYLQPEVVESLVGRLRLTCRAGARLLLLTHSGPTMPEIPQVFEIHTGDHITYRPTSTVPIPSKELPPAEVERMLDGFRIESSYVLRHGVREFVAVRM
jgi:hypothetical protein